ncbi:MAG: hypothetical protein A2X22_12185 [Bacteroidetes bacterium GWF2_49_14]|nr:MAG: hypothetical protein A2X22_12185 [Bacteroidetes bacterium GWF2_49_14]HBB91731.1 hypothetical protein [Bacteroidales bacterium]
MNYTAEQLIDVPKLQALQDKLNAIVPFPSALVDNSGKILTATAWQDVCTKFHRIHPESNRECIKSDQYILTHLPEANPSVTYKCPHGLVDNAIPIIIEGTHIASFFTGQLFLEPPDLDFFRKQAHRYGYDEEAYIEAVKSVPVWSRVQLDRYLDFIKTFTESLAQTGLTRMRDLETVNQIRENEARYRTLAHAIESINECVSMTDSQNTILFVNQAFCQTYGYSREELIGQNISLIRSPGSGSSGYDNILSETIDGGWSGEISNRRKDGTDFPVHVSTAVVMDEENQPVALIGIAVDITERKKNEAELIAAKVKAEESDKLKSAFLANISHEIRTPMNSILGFSELLEEMVTEPQQQNYLKIITKGGERLLNIINSVIDIAKIEAGQLTLSLKDFDLNSLMQELYDLNLKIDSAVEFTLDINQRGPLIIHSDKTKLFQILNNLVSNALKFTRQGFVRFGYTTGKKSITFFVIDSGIGISDDFKSKVFNRFHKDDLHNRLEFEGTGLGLAITKELVTMLKGEIWFDSEVGKGTTFFVRMPVGG